MSIMKQLQYIIISNSVKSSNTIFFKPCASKSRFLKRMKELGAHLQLSYTDSSYWIKNKEHVTRNSTIE